MLIGDSSSQEKRLSTGVPQGSVLGPKIYCIYTYPVGDIIKRHGLVHHCYADDTQIYIMLKPSAEAFPSAINNVEACVVDLKQWMACNHLKVNNDKTELMVFASKQRLQMCTDISVRIGFSTVVPVDHVKNLGVILDKTLSMENHIDAVSRSCRFHLRNISRIGRYLTDDGRRTIVQSLVVSRLDYCNALLHGLPAKSIARLQRVQNAAARLVKRVPYRTHITPILQELHWLPVAKRVEYKILLYTYKCLNDLAPVYLSRMIDVYQPTRPLRSQGQSLLCVPRSKTSTYGNRSFRNAAPVIWNTLPDNIKNCVSITSFKRQLKTYFFQLVYL